MKKILQITINKNANLNKAKELNMKKFINAGLLVGLIFLMTGSAWALPIDVGDKVKMSVTPSVDHYYSNWQNNQNEDFQPDTYVSIFKMENVSTDNSAWDWYNTFCLEKSVTFTPWTENNQVEYWIGSVEDYATSGGANKDSSEIGFDTISDQTKWLYAKYFSGGFGGLAAAGGTTSDGTVYTSGGSYVKNLAQNAIWYLEDEDDSLANDWATINTAFGIFDPLYNYKAATAAGWDIQAANLLKIDVNGDPIITSDVQSQLVGGYNPVPEPATMMLFGIGLLGIAGMGRKRTKK